MRKETGNPLFIALGLALLLALGACRRAETPTPQPAALGGNAPARSVSLENEPAQPAGSPAETAFEPVVSTTFVTLFGEETFVEGAQSTLYRLEHGLYMTFDTHSLEPGDAYTIWWVIFNKPENCSDGVCNLNDMALVDENGARLLADDGAPLPNLPQREATAFSLLRATGAIVDQDGTAYFRAHLPVGDAYEADYGPGLLNPMTADVHLVARSHGQAIPGLLRDQLNSAWGGCPEGWPKDPCRDTQVSIHSPAKN